jgi:hypothetical protein
VPCTIKFCAEKEGWLFLFAFVKVTSCAYGSSYQQWDHEASHIRSENTPLLF